MAFYTGSGQELIGGGSAAEPGSVIKYVVMVATVVMAVLAKMYHLFDQQRFMAAAVRGMADGAVLFYRWMLPDPGAAFVGMACVAQLVDAFRLDHVF